MEKVTRLVQGVTMGHAGMLRATQRDRQQGQVATCRAELGTTKHNRRTRHGRQPCRAALVRGGCTQHTAGAERLREGSGSLSLGLLALREAALPAPE